ncbi:MAG TPA: NrsF family protein [Polyangiaceae bacterium]|nr:NrsF family protein [Polyangiaceae bacterium]
MSRSELPDPASESSRLARLRARVIEQSRQEPALTRAQVSLQNRIVMSVALLIPLLVFGALGGARLAPRPDRLVLQTAVASGILAAVAAVVGVSRGRSMLGRPRSWLLPLVFLTPVALFASRVLASAQYPNMLAEWHGRPGLRCFGLSCVLALGPLLGVLWVRRGSDPVHPRLTAAGVATAAGAGAWVLVDLWCPVGFVPHLLLGHVLPLVLLVALSAALGSRFLTLRVLRDTR